MLDLRSQNEIVFEIARLTTNVGRQDHKEISEISRVVRNYSIANPSLNQREIHELASDTVFTLMHCQFKSVKTPPNRVKTKTYKLKQPRK